jgi:hypothetical protein
LSNFFHGKSYVVMYVIFTKNGLGYTLGDFFTNASGHPGRQAHALKKAGLKK